MTEKSEKLTTRQHKAIAELLRSQSVENAAKAAGVAATTIYRWMSRDEHFQEKLNQAQAAVISSAISLLAGEARLAAETLSEIHRSEDVTPSTRVNAAKAVLSELVKIRNDFDFEARLAVIEEMLEKITNPNKA